MIDWLDQIDKSLMLFFNGFHSPFWDMLMTFLTNKKTWYPVYIALALLIIYRYKVTGLYIVLLIIFAIVLSDQVTSSLMKPYFARLRPCHQKGFQDLLHRTVRCGGQYGFASGHASNSFALATIFFLLPFRNYRWRWIMFLWAAVVAYTRVYVGVHFPGDIIVGSLVGVCCGYFSFFLWKFLDYKFNLDKEKAISFQK